MLPLVGVKVVEFSKSIAGFYSGMILADLGAEVIKIERPEADPARDAGSLWRAAIFVGYNRNKKSLALDLNNKRGKEVLQKLLKSSDILLEDLEWDALNNLGFSYEEVSKLNPQIIYTSIKDCLDGPYKGRTLIDGVIEAESGLMSKTGPAHPIQPLVAEVPPVRLGVQAYQNHSGILAVAWAMGALLTRRETGRGEHISVGRFEDAVSLEQEHVIDFSAWKLFEKHSSSYYKTKDGGLVYLDHIIRSDEYWGVFCKAIGVSEEEIAKTAKIIDRVPGYGYGQFSETVTKIVKEYVTDKYTKAEVWKKIIDTRVPGGVVNDIKTVVEEDPHLNATRFFAPLTASPEVTLTSEKTFLNPLLPIISADYNPDATKKWTPPPKLGEHTAEIIHKLGYAENEIADLRKSKVIWP